MWYVYILRCSDNSLYTWITNNLEKRVFDHNNCTTWAKYTKARRPVELIYHEKSENRSEASKRELAIKKLKKEEKENLVKFFQKSIDN